MTDREKGSIEAKVKEIATELLEEERIKSIVRHEIEERIGKVVWDLSDRIVSILAEKVSKAIRFEEIVEQARSKIPEVIEKALEGWEFRKSVNEALDKVVKEAMPKVDDVASKIVEEVEEDAIRIAKMRVNEVLRKKLEEQVYGGLNRILKDIDELRFRIQRLEDYIIKPKEQYVRP